MFNEEVQKIFFGDALLCLVEQKLTEGILKVARPSKPLSGSSEQTEYIQ